MFFAKKDSSIMYKTGLYLSIIYVFFGFVANGILLPYSLQKIALYGLLAYGGLVLLVEIIHRNYTTPEYSIWYLTILLLCVLTNLYSKRQELMPGNLYNMIVCFLLTVIISEFIRSRQDFIIFCWGNVITSLIMVFLLLITGKLYGSRLERLGEDISGNANVFAMGMMYPCMMAIWLILYEKYKKKVQLILLLIVLIDMYAITLSAGRKSFVLPFVFFYLLLFFKRDKNNRKHLIKTTIITILIILVSIKLIQSIPTLYDSIGIRIEQMLNEFTGGGAVDSSSLVRSEFRKIAIEGWLESPIWGHGFDSFKLYAREKTGYYAYSHCNQTELLFCGGIILFLVYYGMHVWVYFKANNSNLPNGFSAFVKAAILSEFVFDFGLVSYNVFFVQSFIMMSFIAVGFVKEEEIKKDAQEKHSRYKYIKGDIK